MFLIFLGVLLAFYLIYVLFMNQQKFGRLPQNERKMRILNSPNYRDGRFQNLSFTPDLAEGVTYTQLLREFFFNKSKQSKPVQEIPSVKNNLKALDPQQNLLIWMGHSSYYLQVDGKKILVDPVLSGSASPIPITTKSFKGADAYHVDDLPEIDYLILSHDHWDHLDYSTLLALKSRVGKIITGLGTGEHLERWGYPAERIHELDWYESYSPDAGFTFIAQPARHFSGRTFKRNQAIWLSFVFISPGMKIYLGGDSGYDSHFKKIGAEHGPFDLAILECGQYHEHWRYIHMMPEELLLAARDLNTKRLLPVHWAKFSLALHAWNDPIKRLTAAAQVSDQRLLYPKIGEVLELFDEEKKFHPWWEGIN